MEPASVRIVVFGLGIMGTRHARCVAAHSRAKLAATVDPDKTRHDAIAAELNCPDLEDPANTKIDFDAAIVAVPTAAHATVAVPLLEKGISCLIEKPFVGSANAGTEVIAAAKRGNTVVQVGHIERFNPAVTTLINRLNADTGADNIVARRISGASARVTDIDVVMDLMVHDLDVVLAIKGQPVAEVKATGNADHAEALLTFADGGAARLTASRAIQDRSRDLTLTIGGATLHLDYIARTVTEAEGEDTPHPLAVPQHDALALQLDAFIASVRGTPSVASAAEAMVVMETAWRIQRALGIATS